MPASRVPLSGLGVGKDPSPVNTPYSEPQKLVLPQWDDFQKGGRGKVRSSGNSWFHPALGQHLLGIVSPGTGQAVTVPPPLELAEGTGRRQGASLTRLTASVLERTLMS